MTYDSVLDVIQEKLFCNLILTSVLLATAQIWTKLSVIYTHVRSTTTRQNPKKYFEMDGVPEVEVEKWSDDADADAVLHDADAIAKRILK
jgi:hypothetical protein